MTGYREVTGYAREPIQQSMVSLPEDNNHLSFLHMELGVVLTVQLADATQNSSAMQSSVHRGWQHECTVQVVSNGRGGDYRLANVIIPPSNPSGLDNYEEDLPRPSTKTFSGDELDLSLQRTSPYDLDGDWCVVGFLNGNQDQPFIIKWWTNPNNKLDPQTSGEGSPDLQNRGKTLVQTNRSFRRINGVEILVTPKGDIYLDTNFAGTSPNFSEIVDGRYKRDPVDHGGNIKVALKPTGSLELDWNKPSNGVGIKDGQDQYLPQTNPKNGESPVTERENTYLLVDKDVLELDCATTRVNSDTFVVESETAAHIKSPEVLVGKDGGEVTVQGNRVELGDGSPTTIVLSFVNQEPFNQLLATALAAPSGTPTQNAAAIKAIQLFLAVLSTTIYTKAS